MAIKSKPSHQKGKHIPIGDGCLFSTGISMRASDTYAPYDFESVDRINPSKSIVVGNHVSLSERCCLLRGSTAQSGATVDAHAVVAGKTVEANCVYAGNPAKLVRKNVTWEKSGVNLATPDDLIVRQKTQQVFDYRNESLPKRFVKMLEALDAMGASSTQQKLETWLSF